MYFQHIFFCFVWNWARIEDRFVFFSSLSTRFASFSLFYALFRFLFLNIIIFFFGLVALSFPLSFSLPTKQKLSLHEISVHLYVSVSICYYYFFFFFFYFAVLLFVWYDFSMKNKENPKKNPIRLFISYEVYDSIKVHFFFVIGQCKKYLIGVFIYNHRFLL